MDPIMIITFVVMLGGLWLFISVMKNAQKKQFSQQQEAVVLGNNVVTTSGFFGRIVDIDGDAVTLESPAGDETVWLKRSIMAQMDIPFAEITEEEANTLDLLAESETVENTAEQSEDKKQTEEKIED